MLETFEDEMLRIIFVAGALQMILGVATEGLAMGWIEGFYVLLGVNFLGLTLSGINYSLFLKA